MYAFFYFGVFITVICCYIKYRWKRQRLEKIIEMYDGPPLLLILGSLDFYQRSTKGLIEAFFKLTKRYKSPFRLWLANKPYIIIYDPQDFQIAANKTPQKDESYKFIAELLGDGIFTSEGEKWKRHRRLITPAFHMNSLMQDYLKIFNKNNVELIERLKNEVGSGTHFDLWPYFMHTSLTTFCETAMGFENLTSDEAVNFGNAMKRTANLVSQRFHSIWLMPSVIFNAYRYFSGYKKEFNAVRNLPLKLLKKRRSLQRQIKRTGNHIHNIDGERDVTVKSLDRKEKIVQNFVDRLLEFQDANPNFTQNHLFDEVTSIVFGGSETTAIVNCFTAMMLGMNPNIQSKVYKEIFSTFGDSDRLPELDDLAKLPYLEQCIKETLRIFPVVPIIFRRTTSDIAISNGNIIPADTNIALFIYGLHRNPDIYPNPDEWNPSNFDPDKIVNRHGVSFVPFSFGPRKCIGEKYAMIAMKAELSTLLRNFKISTDFTMEEITLDIDLILRSKDGYRVKIEYRDDKSLF